MWLLGRLVPDRKTIADFHKDNGPAIRKVCARFVELCDADEGERRHRRQQVQNHRSLRRTVRAENLLRSAREAGRGADLPGDGSPPTAFRPEISNSVRRH
jgi:hypothetical protein